MRRVLYWPAGERLVYLDARATPEFWDARWRSEGKPIRVSSRDPVVTVTRRYLPRGSMVLEGGCGRANKVKAMADAGFRVVGVDFAERSVAQAKLDYPGLDIRLGDVRSLKFPDGSFDGYWSIGVIEHFWKGYSEIISEAARVLRPQGFLFLSAPWFSPYRQHKVRNGGYQRSDFAEEPDAFYQFALNRREVEGQLAACGFEILRWNGLASEISVKEDMTVCRPQVDWLLGSRGSIVKRALRRVVVDALRPYCGHSFLAVARHA
jgi:SAM-dependent methyltransferase